MSEIQTKLSEVKILFSSNFSVPCVNLRYKEFWRVEDNDYYIQNVFLMDTFHRKQVLPGGLHLPCGLWVLKHFYNWFGL